MGLSTETIFLYDKRTFFDGAKKACYFIIFIFFKFKSNKVNTGLIWFTVVLMSPIYSLRFILSGIPTVYNLFTNKQVSRFKLYTENQPCSTTL